MSRSRRFSPARPPTGRHSGPGCENFHLHRDSSLRHVPVLQEHVLRKGDYSVKARRLASNSAIVQSVGEDTNGIGMWVWVPDRSTRQRSIASGSAKKTKRPLRYALWPGHHTRILTPISTAGSLAIWMMTRRRQPEGNVKTFMDFVKALRAKKSWKNGLRKKITRASLKAGAQCAPAFYFLRRSPLFHPVIHSPENKNIYKTRSFHRIFTRS